MSRKKDAYLRFFKDRRRRQENENARDSCGKLTGEKIIDNYWHAQGGKMYMYTTSITIR